MLLLIHVGIKVNTQSLSSGRPYDVFKGIPFAKPPVKDLRWKRPEPVSDWSGVYNATYFRTYCPQLTTPLYAIIGMNHEDSEDCLYLNVFVPVGVESARQVSFLKTRAPLQYKDGLSKHVDPMPGKTVFILRLCIRKAVLIDKDEYDRRDVSINHQYIDCLFNSLLTLKLDRVGRFIWRLPLETIWHLMFNQPTN